VLSRKQKGQPESPQQQPNAGLPTGAPRQRGSFEVVPAVDVLDGRAVRLHQGVRERIAIEGGDPVVLAERFAAEGAQRVHLVDLDGAFEGRPTPRLLARVAQAIAPVPVQVGGGYRSAAAIEAALAAGADRVMVGTAALAPGFLDAVATRFGEHVVVAVDARDGKVAVEGWTRASEVGVRELAGRCRLAGVSRLLVTGTRRDGSLAGPDLELLHDVLPCGLPVLAAGGIASLDHLRLLRDLGCEGAVVGSALWRGSFTLAEALAAVASS
jgi:phosphoribosylformimino-5-aminoimidazole carboxamide ribotide isomerase